MLLEQEHATQNQFRSPAEAQSFFHLMLLAYLPIATSLMRICRKSGKLVGAIDQPPRTA